MHIPDGFLDTRTWLSLSVVSTGAVAFASHRVSERLREKQIPLIGVTSACIFAAQMLNFPIPGGTSGHFMGGTLAMILLGPWAGLVAMTNVLVVQCLLFGDGGLTALGANIFNMGIVGGWSGYLVWTGLSGISGRLPACFRTRGGKDGGLFWRAFLSGWLSIVAAAVSCSVELAVSGTIPLSVVLPAMFTVHAVIGIGEGLLTWAGLLAICRTEPELIYEFRKAL